MQSVRRKSQAPLDREVLRERIRVAQALAIGNNAIEAHRTLAVLEPAVDFKKGEISALFFQAKAIANIKLLAVDEGLADFTRALDCARQHGDPFLLGKILNNSGTAATQVGRLDLAIPRLEEARSMFEGLTGPKCFALVSLAEATLAAGDLAMSRAVLQEFHAIERGNSVQLIIAATVGIQVGILLTDESLLRISSEPSLLALGMTRKDQWLLGPLVESYCTLYEYQGRRPDHDALLASAVDHLIALDNSALLAIRIARLGPAHRLARVSSLVSKEYRNKVPFLSAHKDIFDAFLARRRGAAQASQRLAKRAAADFERLGYPLMRALALEAAGSGEEARAVRRACGSLGPNLLRWTGAPIHPRLAAQLTWREVQVADLAAQGCTNRSIATALGISERTVHRHCESIFSKLGIRSRWQLAGADGGAKIDPHLIARSWVTCACVLSHC